MKIYRGISTDKVNKEQLGASWTLDEIFAENRAKEMRNFSDSDSWVVMEAEINKDDIDWERTLGQMEYYEDWDVEYEVVLKNGIDIDVEVRFSRGYENENIFSGNTGYNEIDATMTELFEDEVTEELKNKFKSIVEDF